MSKNSKANYQTTKKERVSYGLYFFGQNVFYLFIATFIQVYFTDIGITAASVALIFLIARVWDAVNDPLFGIVVDRSRLKGGRFIPWVRLATFLIPVFTILLFAIPSTLPTTAKTIIAGVVYILWGMSYTICDVPIFALTTAMTGNLQERVGLIASGRVTGMLGMVLAMVLAPVLRPVIGWLGLTVVLSIFAFIAMLPIGFTAKERLVDNESDPITLKAIFKYLGGNKYLLIFYGAMIITSMTNMAQTMSVYFARINLGDEALNGIVMLAALLPMIVIAAILPALSKKFDKMHIYMTGLVINIVFGVVSYFVGYSNFALYLIITAVRGIGMGMTMAMMFMFSADCVEYGSYKTGTRAEGITFSIQTFATKMFGAIAGTIGMLMLSAFGFIEGANVVQPESVERGIWFLMTLFPVIGAAAAFIILLVFYKLNDKDVQIMADCNQGLITREEAESWLSRKY